MKTTSGMAATLAIAAAVAMVTGAGTAALAAPSAHQAGGTFVKESARLHRTAKHGFKLYERGYANGTVKGGIWLELDVVATNRVTAKVTVYPHGGSIWGYGSAAYHVHGSYAEFSGSLTISGGNGRWKGAHGKGLEFAGRIARSNDAMGVALSGTIYR